ncbi:hypothetical protein [Candidatus Magnetomonas plexicatena]|uniref:hypothetical protein n=1 Tax=Candidatus Magnetomonas plexicatena TaxID=2552947 RepID=UPI001103CF3E|nr:hypothetical protein E2O03_003860 [Nitrospirales bacterium LBB_01]
MKTLRWFQYTTISFGFIYVLFFLLVVINRINYPFDLEEGEGIMVDHVIQIITKGIFFYKEPTVDFVPLIYMPLYFYLSALFSQVFGIGYLSLRVVSLLSTCGIAVTIYYFIKKETSNKELSLTTACIFIASSRMSGHWFDLARVDTCFLFFLFFAFFILRFYDSVFALICGGILLTAAFFTKQSASLMLSIALPLYFFYDKRKTVIFFGVFTVVSAVLIFLYNTLSNGWFLRYTQVIPSTHAINYKVIYSFWYDDLGKGFWIIYISVLMYMFCFFYKMLKYKEINRKSAFYVFLCAGCVLVSYVSRLHTGGIANVVMPAYTAFILACGVFINDVNLLIEGGKYNSEKKYLFKTGIYALIIIQLITFFYIPSNNIPKDKTRVSEESFMGNVMQLQGKDVLFTDRAYVSYRINKRVFASTIAIVDLLRSKDEKAKTLFINNYVKNIENKKIPYIIANKNTYKIEIIEQNYDLTKTFYGYDNTDVWFIYVSKPI